MTHLENLLRDARPTVIAALSRYFQSIDLGEDLFQDAVLAALKTWPEKGVPQDPTAWLIRVGCNRGIDQGRKLARHSLPDTPLERTDGGHQAQELLNQLDAADYSDDILRLMFTCCHPVLPVAQQIALCLKIIVGMHVHEIAHAFLVQPKTMEKRITRAKKRIAGEDIPYEAPQADQRDSRIKAVATSIYLLFNEGYAASGGEAHIRTPLCHEAIRLSRLLVDIAPKHPEVKGLLALCLLQHARTKARLDAQGQIILLEDQDRSLWDAPAIGEGLTHLHQALNAKQPGPFQIQAAIAAVHAESPSAQATNWSELNRLYQLLEKINPSPVVTLNRAVAVEKCEGPRKALTLLEALEDQLDNYMYFHGLRAALLTRVGAKQQAQQAFERALKLARTPAEEAHLHLQMDKIQDQYP